MLVQFGHKPQELFQRDVAHGQHVGLEGHGVHLRGYLQVALDADLVHDVRGEALRLQLLNQRRRHRKLGAREEL